MNTRAWQGTLGEQLSTLGHRNWIVVADAAYPSQVSLGVKTVYTGAQQLDVLSAVLSCLDNAGHVKPVVHMNAELDYVSETLAPGVDEHKAALQALLQRRPVIKTPHSQLISDLDAAGKTFEILVLKTDIKIPYTSVFIELDCGYWTAEKEAQLRELIP